MHTPALALAVLTCLAAMSTPTSAFAAATPAPGPRLEIKPASPAATPDFRWTFAIIVSNDSQSGLYPDSLQATAEDLDPGKTDGPRTQVIPLGHVVRVLRPISAGEAQSFTYTGVAYFEHARVTFRLFTHTSDGKKHVTQAVTEIRPGLSSEQYRSETVDVGGHKVEYVFVRGAKPVSPWPGLLLVHGEKGNARRMLPFVRQAALAGYSVMVVSLPGYGMSEGEPDLMGPASMAAVEKAYQLMRGMPDIDTTLLSAWGVSLGAGVVARLATRHPELKAVVLQSGLYDLWAVSRVRGAEGTKEFVRAAGSDSAAWRDRSALLMSTKIPSPVLILHDENDASEPAYQARGYGSVLRGSGTNVEIAFPNDAGRARPLGDAADAGLDFIEKKVAIRKYR